MKFVHHYTLKLTPDEFKKLLALAKRRNRSMNQCITDFINSCTLEDNWEHPEKATTE
jgi:predicted transglutaminase-like cysteine proteinase